MRAAWMVALLAGGCGFEAASGGSGIDAPPIDAVDAPGTEPCPWSVQVPGFEPCPYGNGMFGALDLTEPGVYVYDTESNTLTSPTNAAVMVNSTTDSTSWVIWTRRFRIANGATLRGTGELPLIIVSQGEIAIEGTLDVGSYVVGTNKDGAGSNPPACDSSVAGDGLVCTDGGSGGGGGGFGTTGSSGGVGGVARCGGNGVAGGTVGTASADTSFRGGCNGGDGGDGDGDVGGGSKGAGGGSIHLIALDQLVVRGAGQVLAGGSGGLGSRGDRSGGGGGGSGGLVMLSGRSVRVDAGGVVAANGGGGGGGANQTTNAGAGQDGRPSATPALGGTPESGEGVGGTGGARNVLAMPGIGLDRGGGGGGGGVGKIRITAAAPSAISLGGVISPAPL